jgi:hypothetical protein
MSLPDRISLLKVEIESRGSTGTQMPFATASLWTVTGAQPAPFTGPA